MKTINFAAAAVLALGVASFTPAFAGEGNGPAFDVGSAHYPNVTGRAGTDLVGLGNSQLLFTSGSEVPVQTANSLPRNFEAGTPDYAQAQTRWAAAHNQPRATLAAR